MEKNYRLLGWLAIVMAGLATPALADARLTLEQKALFDQAIHDYLIEHPEAVIEAFNAAQQKSAAQAMERTKTIIRDNREKLLANADDLVAGDPNGTATIVEFFDYRCPYCKAMQPVLDALLKEDPKLRVVYKEFPILGEPSVLASRVAIAAKKQGKYAEFHKAMIATKGEAEITDKVVLKVAASVGLDLKKIKADIEGPDASRIIAANEAIAAQLNIDGTPGLIIGDTLIRGVVGIDTLRDGIAAMRNGG